MGCMLTKRWIYSVKHYADVSTVVVLSRVDKISNPIGAIISAVYNLLFIEATCVMDTGRCD